MSHHHVSKKGQVPGFLQDLERGFKGFIDPMVCCCDARSSSAGFGDPFNLVADILHTENPVEGIPENRRR